MTLEVGPLHVEDRLRWTVLWRDYLAFYQTELPGGTYDETWRRILGDTALHGLAARRDGQTAGITHFLFHGSAWTTAPVCYLQDLFVDPAVRGCRIGRALIEGVAGRARQQGTARLYWLTQDHNAAARRLYDRLALNSGFIRYELAL